MTVTIKQKENNTRLLAAFELMGVCKKIVESEKQLDLATMVVHNTNTCDYSRAHEEIIGT